MQKKKILTIALGILAILCIFGFVFLLAQASFIDENGLHYIKYYSACAQTLA